MALRLAGSIFVVIFCLQRSQTGVKADQALSPLFPHGNLHGDVILDISTTKPIQLPFNISFLDHRYDTLIVSPDGTVAFENNREVVYSESIKYHGGVRIPSNDVPFIAPLLYRSYRPVNMAPSEYQGTVSFRVVDNRNFPSAASQEDLELVRNLSQYLPTTVVHAPKNFDLKFLIVITWENVAEGPELPGIHECRRNQQCNSTTFQLALAGNDSYTFAIFNYGSYNISVKPSYEAGINAGKGRGWYDVLPCQGSEGCTISNPAAVISNLSNIQGSDRFGRYIFSVGQEAVIRGGCLSKELIPGILEVWPRSVGMFGGEKLEFSGVCTAPGTVTYCRYGPKADPSSKTVNATISSSMRGYCPVPPLATAGHLDLYVLDADRVETAYRRINIVLPSRVQPPVAIDKAIQQDWYKKDSKSITVKWDSRKFSDDGNIDVDIKLIGYRETETQVEYRELTKFGSVRNSLNSYTFNVEEHRCVADCEAFEIGLLEISVPSQWYSIATERVAVRYGPIPLGWYVNQQLETTRGSDWSDQKCHEWHEADSRDTAWIRDLLPCPCNLNQALADFGRWQADPGCNLFTGSQCEFHQGVKHCVRSVAATAKDGAGNQCCYNSDGTLSHSQQSYQGSTPDRSHVWGVYPYNRPGRVPELSHWRHDVASFFYCCLWNNYELCDRYMELRPTADCQNYQVPGIGSIYGQTHIKTFDGLSYHLISAGDFWLIDYPGVSLSIHGKFEPRTGSWDLGKKTKTSPWQPRALTGVGVSAGRDKIEVSLALEGIKQQRALDIRVNQELQYFLDPSTFWQDFQDSSIVNNAANVRDNRHNNFTILLPKLNLGLTVVASNDLLQVTVAVPPSFKPQTGNKPNLLGLLGAFDGIADNDFTNRQNQVISPAIAKREIYDSFIFTWKVLPDDYKLFRFENPAQDLDPQHLYFEYSQIPVNFSDAPTPYQVNQVCGDSDNCKWDYQITGEEVVARATRNADDWLRNLQRSATPVESCGFPDVGNHATLSTENFSPGVEVRVTGCRNEQSLDSEPVFRCLKESLEEARRQDRGDYGIKRTNTTTNEEYIIHWIPQPYAVCVEETEEANNLPLIIGATVGGVVLIIIIIVVVVVVVLKKRKSGSSSPKEKTPSERRKKQVEKDPGAAEAMLSKVEDRSPVYKISKEPMRMSEIQGSNV